MGMKKVCVFILISLFLISFISAFGYGDQGKLRIITANVTYITTNVSGDYNYNQTYTDGTYNSTYAPWAYNMTVGGIGSYNYNEEAAGSITGGSVVDERILGSGKNKVSGYDRSAEWILAPSTLYTFAIEAHADNIRASLILDWYEHTPKG